MWKPLRRVSFGASRLHSSLFLPPLSRPRYLAENQHEPGYVTEKPFDALTAGTVPVYKGDSAHLKGTGCRHAYAYSVGRKQRHHVQPPRPTALSHHHHSHHLPHRLFRVFAALLPHPDAAIFLDDFKSTEALVEYLKRLTQDEAAYERHRAWRKNYSYDAVRGVPCAGRVFYVCVLSRGFSNPHAPSSSHPPSPVGLPPPCVSCRVLVFVPCPCAHLALLPSCLCLCPVLLLLPAGR